MTKSPYYGKPEKSWLAITRRLVRKHPLMPDVLVAAATATWDVLWRTRIGEGGTSARLADLNVPAMVVGYFFEALFGRDMERRAPTLWRGGRSKDEKDLVYLPDPRFSIEIKTSGQHGFRVYGNRSYGQKPLDDALVKKEKAGYYLTVNFFRQSLSLIRFGWIDADDWAPQLAPTGQMAGLKQAVYDYKLLAIPGTYRQHAPVSLLNGVGPAAEEQFDQLGIRTIGELLRFRDALSPRLERVRIANEKFLDDCRDKLLR